MYPTLEPWSVENGLITHTLKLRRTQIERRFRAEVATPCILEQGEELGADLIALGKHGAGMAEELLLGSVTKHVLAQARWREKKGGGGITLRSGFSSSSVLRH